MFSGDETVVLDEVHGSHPVQVDITRIGGPLHCNSVGKLHLAFLPDGDIEEYLARPRERYTERTIVDSELLRAELARARANRYAVAYQEGRLDWNGVSAVACDRADRPLACLNVTVPSYRYTRRHVACAQHTHAHRGRRTATTTHPGKPRNRRGDPEARRRRPVARRLVTRVVVTHSATLEINERVAAYRSAGRRIVHLGFGEAGLPVLPVLADRLREAAGENSYPPVAGSEEVRHAAAGYWHRRGIRTGDNQILLAPGSKPLLYAALAAIEGDVVLPVPSWVTYAAQAALAGKRVITSPIPMDHGGIPEPGQLDDTLRRARADGADPRLLVVTLPDNPTGTAAPEAAVREVCEIADRHGLVIISDEIYRDLCHGDARVTSPASLLPDRTIVTSGLSKNLALGGWRIGFARLPDTTEGAGWRAAMLGIASELWSCPASPMEGVAAYALGEPEVVTDHIARSRGLHAEVAAAVAVIFTDAGADLRKPTAGFYIYPDLESARPRLTRIGIRTGADVARYLLDEHGLAVLPGESFGDTPTAFRFRAATSLLYGDTDQRWEALESAEPTRLPWIARELERLRDIVTTVMG